MKHEESRLQAACVEWFRYQYPSLLIASFANGGARSGLQGKILKDEGVLAGMPDLEINFTGGVFYIEMKLPGEGLTGKQPEIVAKLRKLGRTVYVCHSIDEFMHTVKIHFLTQQI